MNCIIVDDDFASRQVIRQLLRFRKEIQLVTECESAIEAVEVLKNEAIDLIYLDIDMPEMSGLELMDSLKEPPQIIFVTGNDNFAIEAFQKNAVDYLVKPVSKQRFLQATDKALGIFEKAQEPNAHIDFLFVKKDSVLHKIAYRDISHIEAQADYISIHTAKKSYLALSTMHSIEKRLPANHFVRVHRSYIVNVHHLDKIEEGTAIIGQHMIPVGNTYKQRLYRTINVI
jgi:DNA-binding LytR/AlgR family response regulator